MARAKELFVWSPSFKDVPEVTHCSDVDSFKNASNNNVEDGPGVHIEGESDCDAVSDTFFRDSDEVNENTINQSVNDKESSKDPFGIYELLKKSKADGNSESSIPFPPGYKPDKGSVRPTSCTSNKDLFGIYELLKKSKADGNSESSIPFPPGYTPDKGSVRPTSCTSNKDLFGIYELLKKSKADGNSESSIPFPPGYTPDKGSVRPTSCTSNKDLFGIYELLKKSKADGNSESSIPFPPGYTPDKGRVTHMVRPTSDTLQEMQGDHMKSASCTPRVFEE
nr:RNA-directed DNA polymerase, eukaryota [Tanacetum cinerariifolium]